MPNPRPTLLECAQCKTRYHPLPGLRKCGVCQGKLAAVKPVLRLPRKKK